MSSLFNFSDLDPKRMFIETGTGVGVTLARASCYFDHCVSVERDRVLYEEAVVKFENFQNVRLYYGNSPEVLCKILRGDEVVVFWLDAHYDGNGDRELWQCPLLGELHAIVAIHWAVKPIVMIDDAFMFTADVSTPVDFDWSKFRRAEWPHVEDIDQILTGFVRSLRGDVFYYEAA